MNILLAGGFSSPPDEGMRRVAASLRSALARSGAVAAFDLERAGSPPRWRAAKQAGPDAVLYVPGPSNRSLLILRALKRFTGARRSACLTLNPENLADGFARRLLPDVVFTHSEGTEARFRRLGARTAPLPMGVDTARFRPPAAGEKATIRRDLGIPADVRVILHVGHLKASRNLRALLPLAAKHHVVVVGSTATAQESELVRELRAKGARVLDQFLPDVERVYRAADAYVFPVEAANNSTELPISILEALASGLPVVSTPYGAVPRFFADHAGVRLASAADLGAAIEAVLAAPPTSVAAPWTWDEVASRIVKTLEALA